MPRVPCGCLAVLDFPFHCHLSLTPLFCPPAHIFSSFPLHFPHFTNINPVKSPRNFIKKWKYLFYLSSTNTAASTIHSAVALLHIHAVTHIFRSSGKSEENADRESHFKSCLRLLNSLMKMWFLKDYKMLKMKTYTLHGCCNVRRLHPRFVSTRRISFFVKCAINALFKINIFSTLSEKFQKKRRKTKKIENGEQTLTSQWKNFQSEEK